MSPSVIPSVIVLMPHFPTATATVSFKVTVSPMKAVVTSCHNLLFPVEVTFPPPEPSSQVLDAEEEEAMDVEDDASMISRTLPSRSEASNQEDSQEVLPDPPASILLPTSEEPLPFLAFSSWQEVVSAFKLKFEGDMLPPSSKRRT